MMDCKFVEAKWIDSASNGNWVEHSELPEPVIIISRGWLVTDAPKYITLAASHQPRDGGGHMYGEAIAIPKCALLGKVRDLKC